MCGIISRWVSIFSKPNGAETPDVKSDAVGTCGVEHISADQAIDRW